MLYRVLLACALFCALSAPVASADPASGPREDINQTFTATQPGVPTGLHYDAKYHAAGDPSAPPPFMRRMTFPTRRG